MPLKKQVLVMYNMMKVYKSVMQFSLSLFAFKTCTCTCTCTCTQTFILPVAQPGYGRVWLLPHQPEQLDSTSIMIMLNRLIQLQLYKSHLICPLHHIQNGAEAVQAIIIMLRYWLLVVLYCYIGLKAKILLDQPHQYYYRLQGMPLHSVNKHVYIMHTFTCRLHSLHMLHSCMHIYTHVQTSIIITTSIQQQQYSYLYSYGQVALDIACAIIAHTCTK